ncbi:MAG TPA: ABC transporter permease [Gemmataceae bacterium]|nr:ABC transporter permease [Gemmataceae bacterium]
MDFLVTIRIALRALAKNKLRAALTLLGIVIGIAAVTTMVSLGQSASQLVQNQLQGLGTNVLLVFPASNRSGGVRQSNVTTLRAGDADAIARECPSVLAASPMVFAGGPQVIYGNTNWKPRDMFGVGPDYLTVRNANLKSGDFFSEQDITSQARVCVIGQTIVVKLFQTSNPIGESIRIKNTPFRIIGVLEPRGADLVGNDQYNVVLVPYTTVQKRLQGSTFNDINAIMLSARSTTQMAQAEDEVRQLLYERHRIPPGDPADFEIQNSTQIASILGIITGTITLMLASIAGISLVVGGVGIMNIMLVSVTERTREIGIRMALGARSRDILRQFLTEAVLLSTIGGIIGVGLGIGASAGLTMIINSISSGAKWPVVISFPAAAIAMLFAGGVGVFFGFYPARRASKLDPIEALRYE